MATEAYLSEIHPRRLSKLVVFEWILAEYGRIVN